MKRAMIVAALSVIILALVTISASAQQKRLALVIGNGNYTNAPVLRNPPDDARAMTA